MQKLTGSNIVAFINQLDKNVAYNYLDKANKGLIRIVDVELPEGPIRIKRWNPEKGEKESSKKTEPISSVLIWRIANAFLANQPINFDRVLGGSYNLRSVLEALLAHSPQFRYCYPGRLQNTGGNPTVKHGHKHLMWTPDNPHKKGIVAEEKTEIVISEVPTIDAVYEALVLPTTEKKNNLDIDIQRRHAQIQIALYNIGRQLNFRTWIAQNDKGILYQNKKLGEHDGIIVSLKDEKLMSAYSDAIRGYVFCILPLSCILVLGSTCLFSPYPNNQGLHLHQASAPAYQTASYLRLTP